MPWIEVGLDRGLQHIQAAEVQIVGGQSTGEFPDPLPHNGPHNAEKYGRIPLTALPPPPDSTDASSRHHMPLQIASCASPVTAVSVSSGTPYEDQ